MYEGKKKRSEKKKLFSSKFHKRGLARHQIELLPELVLQVVDLSVHSFVGLNIVVQLTLSLDKVSEN